MNWIDFVIIAILSLNIFLGFRKGLIKIVFSLVALTLATIVAIQQVAPVAELLKNHLSFPNYLINGLSFFAIWILIYFIIYFIGNTISKIFRLTPLGFVDIFGGMFVGFIKGMVIILLFVIPLLTLPYTSDFMEDNIENSIILSWHKPIVDWGRIILNEFWPSNLGFPKLIEPQKHEKWIFI